MIHHTFGFCVLVLALPVQAKGTAPAPKWASPGSARESNYGSISFPKIAPVLAKSKSTATPDQPKAKTAATILKTAKKDASIIAAHTTATTKSVISSVKKIAEAGQSAIAGRLARLTAYWSGEGDYYTGRGISSTGIHLHGGHCAVDPSIIPYGSIVEIAGLGKYLAVDTGSAVISREAAREAGHNSAERNALVIDLFFESRREGEHFAANGPKFAAISWSKPDSGKGKDARHLLADEENAKNHASQL